MCGLAALFEKGRVFAPALLDDIERDLFHRGPDSGGRVVEPGLALVFRRLAILDPRSASDQPMTDPSGRFTIVFNGEIYNFRRLRDELRQANVTLRTSGDTEVILQGYALWGERVLDKLEGMFAFVIVDHRERMVLAARDPFGIKPLYVHRNGPLTAFASELRPLTRFAGATPDKRALAELLTFRFAAGRLSNLQHIEKVPAGTLVRMSLDHGTYSESKFADPLSTFDPDPRLGEAQARELALDALRRSVRDHLQSDVGYALQLSGGIDSSLVAALAAKEAGHRVSSFGVSLPGLDHDEGKWQRAVAERYQLDHHELPLDDKSFADALPRAIASMEGPTPHFGCVALRYFNVAGASPDGEIGEDHTPETHLIPLVLQVPLGKRDKVKIFGEDYDTPDGTCIRDYIHVMDLADAHRLAADAIEPGVVKVFNLGNGEGFSVRQIIDTCRQVTGHPIPADPAPRRPGDPARLVASPDKARTQLGWQPKYPDVRTIVQHAWNWHRK
jgi:asparagine synthase (glutamine-hydrolysing)